MLVTAAGASSSSLCCRIHQHAAWTGSSPYASSSNLGLAIFSTRGLHWLTSIGQQHGSHCWLRGIQVADAGETWVLVRAKGGSIRNVSGCT